MKKMTGVRAILLLSCMAIVFSLASCNTPMDKLRNDQTAQEQKYTIWLDTSTPDVFQKVFRFVLKDGYFWPHEFDAAEWGRLSKNLGDTGKYTWIKELITAWLRDQGLDEKQAAEQLAWFTTIEHGCIAARHKDTVYYLIK